MENIEDIIADFDKQIPQIELERKPLYDLRDKFVAYFNKEKLATMTIEEYCGDKGTDWHIFCNGLWKTLVGLSMDLSSEEKDQSSICTVCGVSYQKNEYKYSLAWKNKVNPFEKIKTAIIELYDAGEKKDWEKIENENKDLFVWFKILFLSVYFPNNYLSFCKPAYLHLFCQELLGVSENGQHFSLQRKLLKIKEEHPIMKDWSMDMYAYFLWNCVKEEHGLNIDIKEAMETSLVTTYKSFLLKNHNMIFTGAPGTGKTYLAKQIAASIIGCDVEYLKGNKQFGFVQFHPSYDYTDFVEGLRPSEDENKEFELRQGIFKKFCSSALKAKNEYIKEYEDDPDGKNAPKFIFIIDEINRGEISKIFGELFFSIDPGYRGETGIVKTQYQNMVTDGPFMDGFYVPDNVYIIGTMNDIDRSVETLDFAFRRRFPSIEIQFDGTLDSIVEHFINTLKEKAQKYPEQSSEIQEHIEIVDKVKQNLVSLNNQISDNESLGLGSEYCIGGAYLLKLKDVDYKYEDLWKFYIEPVIAEYFRGLPSQERKANIGTLKNAFLTKSNETKSDNEE